MSNQSECLSEAYSIIGRLAREAWANPQEVPLPIARLLMHARDYVGRQLSEKILEGMNEPGMTESAGAG